MTATGQATSADMAEARTLVAGHSPDGCEPLAWFTFLTHVRRNGRPVCYPLFGEVAIALATEAAKAQGVALWGQA